jgi:ribosomal protein S18 acetylase RimI-like enzyme
MDTIRDYNPSSDSEKILDLLKGFQAHLSSVDKEKEIHSFTSESDAIKYLEKMVTDINEMNGKFLVFERDTKLLGFIQGIIGPRDDSEDIMYQTTHFPQTQGWIGLLYVVPEMRGQKIGLKLIESIKEYFKRQGCTTVRLLVSSDNRDSINFYKKFGFKERDLEMGLLI